MDIADKAPQLAKKVFHFRRLIRRAAKKARTFEIQKLVKKIKAVQKEAGDAKDATSSNAPKNSLEVLEKDLRTIKVRS